VSYIRVAIVALLSAVGLVGDSVSLVDEGGFGVGGVGADFFGQGGRARWGGPGGAAFGQRLRKQFFFEKKNQKTFIC
jgi:hypothetical protein